MGIPEPGAVAGHWPVHFSGELQRHQREALARLQEVWDGGARRTLVVLPPGAGKTVVGLLAVARLGRPAVVLSPNTAIQGQWAAQWRRLPGSEAFPVGIDRSLSTPVTSLTYQSVAAFDADREVDEDGSGRERDAAHLDRLHDQARAFVDRLVAMGEVTLVLDECHHLLEVWGELLAEILEHLPEAHVVGLTATPAAALDADQAALVDQLFGAPVYSASIPALVRDGRLAPYAELAFLCAPTAAEATWLAEEAERFAELRTDLMDPQFASPGFLTWVDARIQRVGAGEWVRLEREKPDLARALLRFHTAGLAPAAIGARVREEHRHEPRADDWAVVVGSYVAEVLRDSTDPVNIQALDSLRRALPSIGFHLAARGVRRGRSPVDRVLARSEAKTVAAVDIVASERRNLGGRLRALVLSDHEAATATLPARLTGVLQQDAGSAVSAVAALSADPGLAGTGVAMVTGRTVAGNPAAVAALLAEARASGMQVEAEDAGDGLARLVGPWTSRQWVPVVTRVFESGRVPVLVGTRALLGEGWDARTVTTLVDLTSATTPTAVVQTRGRALRIDPEWLQKVAHTWSVVCIDHTHPRGWQDYERFVRKHSGYLGIDEVGEVVAGVSHVSSGLSPYEPPEAGDFDSFNAGMLVRAENRDRTRSLWKVGTPYEDEIVPTLHVRTPVHAAVVAAPELPEPPMWLPAPGGLAPAVGARPANPARLRPPVVVAVLATAAVILGVTAGTAAWWLLALLLLPAAGLLWARAAAGERSVHVYEQLQADPGLETYAAVVADALHAAGRCPQTAKDVQIRWDGNGYAAALPGPAAADFAAALDEVVSAPVLPRYVIARPRLPVLEAGTARARRQARAACRGRLDVPEVCVAVPTLFGVNAKQAALFAGSWQRWVAVTEPHYTGSPVGAGLLASASGQPPVAGETWLRTRWE